MIPKYRLFFIFNIFFIILFLIGCTDTKDPEKQNEDDISSIESIDKTTKENTILLHYVNSDKTNLVEYELEYHWTNFTNKQNVENIIAKLKEGTGTKNIQPSIPKNVIVNRIDFNDNNNSVVIDFSKDYHSLSNGEAILLRASVVLSLTNLDYISAVKITVDGQPLLDPSGQPIGFLDDQDVVMGIEDYLLTPNTLVITLYFANEDGTTLVPEIRSVSLEPGQTLEQVVLKELLNGPEDTTLKPTIPEGTKVIEVFKKDGIGYVDLNEQFLYNSVIERVDEQLTIYSIVNSLTDLPNVNQVQFLIQGVKHENYKSVGQFNKLFSRNLDIIEKK